MKTYTRAGLHHEVTDATEHPTLHDGRLVDVGPFNRHLRHVTTFRRVLTAAEMADLVAILEAA